jgi:tocopherol O-methyltransferase
VITPAEPQRVADVAEHYDELDTFYREIWGDHLHHGLWEAGDESRAQATENLALYVAAQAKAEEGSAVCDIGTGYGATARLLASRFGARVTGFTVSPVQLAYARSQTPSGDNPSYVLRDWMENGLPPAAFDACISIESSEHMPDKERFFSECRRVLKPGGRLVICAWLARTGAGPAEVKYLLEPICREGRLPGMGDEDEYRGWLTRAGFSLVAFRDVSRNVRRTWEDCTWGMLRYAAVRPSVWKYLASDGRNRVFAKTVPRIWLAYALGAMRYGIFTALAR